MKCTWGLTNRMYAKAAKSGDPAQLAWVRYLRGKITALRNRRAGHAHTEQPAIPAQRRARPSGADVCLGPSVGLPVRSIRAGENAQAPATNHSCDPAHELQRYHVAAEMLRHFADVLDSETVAGLEAIKEYYERRQPVEHVRETVKRSLRRW